MDLEIKGKTALVMGGTSGIGFSIAELFVQEGMNVIIVGRDFARLELASKHLKRVNPAVKVQIKQMDLLDEKKIRKGMTEILAKNALYVVINNVGGPAAGATLEVTLADWDRGYQSLLRSVILVSQLVVPGMAKRKWGRILTITSTSAREMMPRLPISAVFRAGLTAFAKNLAKDHGRSGIFGE